MSKIGSNPVIIPDEVTITLEGNKALFKGPKGEANMLLPKEIKVEIKEKQVIFTNQKTDKPSKALHGLTRMLFANYVQGVKELWQKGLEIHGVGYRAKIEGTTISFQIGYSHPVNYEIPKDVNITLKGNKILVEGIDKQRVGEVGAIIKRIRKPDKYKGKGIRYAGEILKLKPGKKAKTTA